MAATLVLGWAAGTPGIATGYVDDRQHSSSGRISAKVFGRTAPDFDNLPELRPIFERRLRDFDLYSGDAIATTIVARSQDEITAVIDHHPEADFVMDGQFRLSSKVIQRP